MLTSPIRVLLFASCAATLLLTQLDAQGGGRRGRGGGSDATWKFLSKKYDKNKNGKISFKEYKRDKAKFKSMDKNGDGSLTESDFSGGGRGRGGRGSRGGRGGRSGRGGRGDRGGGSGGSAKLGKKAPDFNLPIVKTPKKTIKLSSFAGKKPVALIFGSYT